MAVTQSYLKRLNFWEVQKIIITILNNRTSEFVSINKIQNARLIKFMILLSNLGTIHGELWGHKILYSQSL